MLTSRNRPRSSKSKSKSRSYKEPCKVSVCRDGSPGRDGRRPSVAARTSVKRGTCDLDGLGSRRRKPTDRSTSRRSSQPSGRSRSRRPRDKSVSIADDACRWNRQARESPRLTGDYPCSLPPRLSATTSQLLGEASALSRHLRRKNHRDFEVYGDSGQV